MSHDSDPSISVLSRQECYALLATRQIGRLGVISEHYPLITPVNYALDLEVIIFRSRPGTKLAAADHGNVTFEVDDIDERNRSGWSVLVRGQAEEVTEQHSIDLIERTELQPWAPGDDFRWLRIIPHGISGRRINPGLDWRWELGTAAYM